MLCKRFLTPRTRQDLGCNSLPSGHFPANGCYQPVGCALAPRSMRVVHGLDIASSW